MTGLAWFWFANCTICAVVLGLLLRQNSRLLRANAQVMVALHDVADLDLTMTMLDQGVIFSIPVGELRNHCRRLPGYERGRTQLLRSTLEGGAVLIVEVIDKAEPYGVLFEPPGGAQPGG